MNKEERPFWLRGQENGVLAWARIRSFLLERFWILERSVDIEGADFSAMTPSKQTMKREQLIGLIQRNAKFMDRRDISGLKAYEQ